MKILKLILFMLISGSATAYILTAVSNNMRADSFGFELLFTATYLPGLTFGISLGTFFVFEKLLNIRKFWAFIIASCIAYFASFFVLSILSHITGANILLTGWSINYSTCVSLFVSGFLGSSIIALIVSGAITKIGSGEIILTSVLGGLSSITLVITNTSLSFYILFITWHLVVGSTLGIFVINKTRKQRQLISA